MPAETGFKILTTQEVAEKFSMCPQRVRRLIASGDLKPLRLLGSKPFKFDEAEVIKAIRGESSLTTESAKSLGHTISLPRSKAGARKKESLWP